MSLSQLIVSRRQGTSNMTTFDCEAALNRVYKQIIANGATAVYNYAPVEFESNYVGSHRTGNEDVTQRDVILNVKEWVAKMFLTMVNELVGDILQVSLHNAKS